MAESNNNQVQGSGAELNNLQKPELRTMQSDLKSIQDNGGVNLAGYTPVPQPSTEKLPIPQVPKTESAVPSAPPFSDKDKSDVFDPFKQFQAQPAPPVASAQRTVPVGATSAKSKSKSKKGLAVFLFFLMIAAVLGGLFYFFILPVFQEQPAVDLSSQSGSGQKPAGGEENDFSPTETGEDLVLPEAGSAGADQISENEPVVSEPTPIASQDPGLKQVYQSFLTVKADAVSDITLNFASPNQELRNVFSFTPKTASELKEIKFTKTSGGIPKVSDLRTVLPAKVTSGDLLEFLKEEFNYLIYSDEKGVWPVYILKLKDGADKTAAKSTAAGAIEGSAGELKNLFLTDPSGETVWKDGLVKNHSARYLPFAQAGASLNYFWIGDFLVIATSYSAAQEAGGRLSQ